MELMINRQAVLIKPGGVGLFEDALIFEHRPNASRVIFCQIIIVARLASLDSSGECEREKEIWG